MLHYLVIISSKRCWRLHERTWCHSPALVVGYSRLLLIEPADY